jgi:hypothetical protein
MAGITTGSGSLDRQIRLRKKTIQKWQAVKLAPAPALQPSGPTKAARAPEPRRRSVRWVQGPSGQQVLTLQKQRLYPARIAVQLSSKAVSS